MRAIFSYFVPIFRRVTRKKKERESMGKRVVKENPSIWKEKKSTFQQISKYSGSFVSVLIHEESISEAFPKVSIIVPTTAFFSSLQGYLPRRKATPVECKIPRRGSLRGTEENKVDISGPKSMCLLSVDRNR